MMEPLLIIGIITALLVLWKYLKTRRYVRLVNQFPGPKTSYFLGNIPDFWRENFDMLKILHRYTLEYQGAYRLWDHAGKSFITIIDPDDAEIVLSSNKVIDKSEDYQALHPWVGLGLLTSTGQKWHSRRKLLTPTFHFKILEEFIEVFNRHSDTLIEKMLSEKEPVSIYNLVSLCTLDVICETAMGVKVHAQEQQESSYVSSVKTACFTVFERSVKPWFGVDLVFNLSSLGKKFYKAVDVMHKMTESVISQRKIERQSTPTSESKTEDDDIGLKKRPAFLNLLLDANDSGKANLSDKDIREEVDTFMFEGHDTTAACITFALYSIAANEKVQDRIVQECDDIFGDSDRPATYQDLQSMHYLEWVIKETLRLYPSVPVIGREVNEDLTISGGRIIPAGCSINLVIYSMGRNPKYFPDPERFDPERWSPEQSVGRHPFAHVPFSAGPRNCIGQKFALLELKSTISHVVRHCRLSLPSPDYKLDVVGQVILRSSTDLKLVIKAR